MWKTNGLLREDREQQEERNDKNGLDWLMVGDGRFGDDGTIALLPLRLLRKSSAIQAHARSPARQDGC